MRILRQSGCEVELIAPDAGSLKAFGPSIGDEHHRAHAFEAARIEGRARAATTEKLWRD